MMNILEDLLELTQMLEMIVEFIISILHKLQSLPLGVVILLVIILLYNIPGVKPLLLSIGKFIVQHFNNRKLKKSSEYLKLSLLENQCWWILTKQTDENYSSQISLKILIHNLSTAPIGIVKTRLIRPRTKDAVLHASTIVPKMDIYDSRNKVSACNTVRASSDILVSGKLMAPGKKLALCVGVTDQFGKEHHIKGIIRATNDESKSLLFDK